MRGLRPSRHAGARRSIRHVTERSLVSLEITRLTRLIACLPIQLRPCRKKSTRQPEAIEAAWRVPLVLQAASYSQLFPGKNARHAKLASHLLATSKRHVRAARSFASSSARVAFSFTGALFTSGTAISRVHNMPGNVDSTPSPAAARAPHLQQSACHEMNAGYLAAGEPSLRGHIDADCINECIVVDEA